MVRVYTWYVYPVRHNQSQTGSKAVCCLQGKELAILDYMRAGAGASWLLLGRICTDAFTAPRRPGEKTWSSCNHQKERAWPAYYVYLGCARVHVTVIQVTKHMRAVRNT